MFDFKWCTVFSIFRDCPFDSRRHGVILAHTYHTHEARRNALHNDHQCSTALLHPQGIAATAAVRQTFALKPAAALARAGQSPTNSGRRVSIKTTQNQY
jgi:hypothetical protein